MSQNCHNVVKRNVSKETLAVRLIRGWEKQYCPEATGGLRLSKPTLYRTIGEEDGLGDQREGEIRIADDGGALTIEWKVDEPLSLPIPKEMQERLESEISEQFRELLAREIDDPDLDIEPTEPRRWKLIQNLKVSDQGIDSPFLFCLAREPVTRADWERVRAALPERYDTWTVTKDVRKLQFEIECGIKRWMGLNEITRHSLEKSRNYIDYSYDVIPPSGDLAEVLQMSRWFRKSKKYRNQEEYRLAWKLSSPQWERMPESIDIELTKTGLHLFEPWIPPDS